MANRLCRSGLLLALSLVLLPRVAGAQAPQRERIALHPCVITGGKKANVSDLEDICASAAVRESMNLVPSSEVRAYLEEKEHGSCARAKNRNACLGRLATATKATHALYITLNPFTPKSTRITGVVVDETGKKIDERPLELSRVTKQPPSEVVRFAVLQLLEKLDVAKAPTQELLPIPAAPGTPPEPEPVVVPSPSPETTPTVTAPPQQQPAPVASVKQEAPRVRTGKSTVGIIGMAVGGAGLVVSGLMFNGANSKAKEFNDAYKNGAPPQAELQRLAMLRDDGESQRKTATIAAAAGGALVVGGAILWLTDGSSSSAGSSTQGKVGTTRILAGPGQVGLSVLLP